MIETIAECGHNHGGDLGTALALIVKAAEAGADTVKFQMRDNRNLFTREAFDAPYNSENAYGATYGLHREALELSYEDFKVCAKQAADAGVDIFSTAFDIPSLDKCIGLGFTKVKLASGSLTNTPLVRQAARSGLRVYLSTGGAELPDVDRAVDIVEQHSCDYVLMQCTAEYPAAYHRLNLKVIQTYKTRYPNAAIGYSAHQNGYPMTLAAAALGAEVVEQHFTLDRSMKGTDHSMSLEPQGLTKLVRDIRRFELALGDGQKYSYCAEEAPIKKMSCSLYASRDLSAGHVLAEDDIVIKCPGGGLAPYELSGLIGRRLVRPLGEEQPIGREDVD